MARTAAAVLLAAAALAAAAAAQPNLPGPGNPVGGPRLVLQLPPPAPPAATAGPRVGPAPEHGRDCAPTWPCRLRLFGWTGRDGGIGLKGPALNW